jgi:hypothetical protein
MRSVSHAHGVVVMSQGDTQASTGVASLTSA